MTVISRISRCNQKESKLEITFNEVIPLWEKLISLSFFDQASELMDIYTTGSFNKYQFYTYCALANLPENACATSQNVETSKNVSNSDAYCYNCKRLKPNFQLSNNFAFVNKSLILITENKLKTTVFECGTKKLKQLVVSKLVYEDLVVDLKNFLVVS